MKSVIFGLKWMAQRGQTMKQCSHIWVLKGSGMWEPAALTRTKQTQASTNSLKNTNGTVVYISGVFISLQSLLTCNQTLSGLLTFYLFFY